MAKTNIKKNAKGYGYTYTDLAQINAEMENQGLKYYQYIEPYGGEDYICTVIEGEGETRTVRGCRIPEATLSGKSNPAQEYGSAITYARRYSLLMALGWATTDDDAACMTVTQQDGDISEVCMEIRKLADKLGISEEVICNMGKVDKLEDMHWSQANSCLGWLKGQL